MKSQFREVSDEELKPLLAAGNGASGADPGAQVDGYAALSSAERCASKPLH